MRRNPEGFHVTIFSSTKLAITVSDRGPQLIPRNINIKCSSIALEIRGPQKIVKLGLGTWLWVELESQRKCLGASLAAVSYRQCSVKTTLILHASGPESVAIRSCYRNDRSSLTWHGSEISDYKVVWVDFICQQDTDCTHLRTLKSRASPG